MLSASFRRFGFSTAGAIALWAAGCCSAGIAVSNRLTAIPLLPDNLPSPELSIPGEAPLPTVNEYLPPLPDPKATHVVLRLSDKRVYVYGDDQVLADFPVAVGAPETPTPTGEFEIFQMIVDPIWQSPWTGEVHEPGADSALGLRWIGFASMDNGIIGFHGTPTVSSIGYAVSNGCVRLRNEDVLALFEHVHMGMTVLVE
jgi:hypothetical protein